MFLLRITFKFYLGMLGGELLIMFRRKELSGKSYRLLCEYPLGHLVGEAYMRAVPSPYNQVRHIGAVSFNLSLVLG